MDFVTSADGTRIAYQRQGSGPTLIFCVGAFNDHNTGAALAAELARQFTVITYDDRGRGQSGDAAEYAVAAEIEDIAAVLNVAGSRPALLGFSSGALLLLEAARQGLELGKLVLVEPPYVVAASRPPIAADFPARLRALVEAGKRGEAVELFQSDLIGIPPQIVAQLRHAPFRPGLEAMAHTTAYDATIARDLGYDATLPSGIHRPVLTIAGTDSAPFLIAAAKMLAERVHDGRFVSIEGMNHDLTPALAPAILDFLR